MGFVTYFFPLVALLLLGLIAYGQIATLQELRALRMEMVQQDPEAPAEDP